MAILKWKNVNEVLDDQLAYIKKRKDGELKNVLTGWRKVNECMGGFEWGTIVSINGPSGTGKTNVLEQLCDEIQTINTYIPIHRLHFNLEMLARNLVTRKQARYTEMNSRKIYSGYGETLTDKELEKIHKISELKIRNTKLDIVDDSGTVPDIKATIKAYRNKLDVMYKSKGIDYGLLITLDHTILVEERASENERVMIKNLIKLFNIEKKVDDTLVIVLGQTNRSLDDMDRLNNERLQCPVKSDIFGSDSVFQGSDYVWIMMNPKKLGLNVWQNTPTEGLLFWHVLKIRDGGEIEILLMKDLLQYSTVIDYDE